MAVHWTCAIPQACIDIERSSLLADREWEELYKVAEDYLCCHTDVFDDSIRHTVVKKAIGSCFPDRGVRSLPLAVTANKYNKALVTWSGTDVILGDNLIDMIDNPEKEQFQLLVRCM